jgi:hypothetical protein
MAAVLGQALPTIPSYLHNMNLYSKNEIQFSPRAILLDWCIGLTVPWFRDPKHRDRSHFFSGIQILVLIQKRPFFGTNFKNNCLWIIHIEFINSTTINNQYYWICNSGIVRHNTSVTEIWKLHETQTWFTRHIVAYKRKSEYCKLINDFRDCCITKI